MRKTLPFLLLGASLFGCGKGSRDVVDAAKQAGVLVAKVACSVKEYAVDKGKPDAGAEITCSIRNDGDSPVRLWGAFGTANMLLTGQGADHPRESGLWVVAQQVDKEWIVPAKGETVVFRGPLRSVLDPDGKEYAWEWDGTPKAPPSPVLKEGGKGYEPSIRLRFAVALDRKGILQSKKKIVSEPVPVGIVAR